MAGILFFLLVICNLASAMTKTEVKAVITNTAYANGIDPDLAVAIAMTESSLNPEAIGALGEVGVFQLRPEYHNVIKGNTKQNIVVGIVFLAELKAKFANIHGDAWFVFFNYGPHSNVKNVRRTKYYAKVMTQFSRIKFDRYIAKDLQ